MAALRKRDIPNALTLLRLVLAALTIALLSLWTPSPEIGARGVDWLLLLAAICFATGAVTDALDGYLARKWSAISIFGRIMDPFADKILVLGALIAMASGPFTGLDIRGEPYHPLAPLAGFTGWMVTLILARELLVTSIRGIYESRGIDFSATASGKAKMMLQSGAIPLILTILALSAGDPRRPAALTISILAWLTTLVTLWSAVPYVTKAMRTRAGAPPVPGNPGTPLVPRGLGTPPVPGGSEVSQPPAPSSPAPSTPATPDSPLNDPESPLPRSPGSPQSPPTPAPWDDGGTQRPPPGAGP